MPASFQQGDQIVELNSHNFDFRINNGFSSPILKRAIQRYKALVFYKGLALQSPDQSKSALSAIDIFVISPDESLTLQTFENYTLTISSTKINLVGQSVYAAIRGLETFSQLVNHDEGKYYVRQASIVDAPRFPFRGILIDSSRHFLEINSILKVLDAMSYAKMNVLHWHLVDDNSFPYQSKVYPELSAKGSWLNNPNHIYNHDQIRKIIDYAKDRGIRVIPEFDTPAHTKSWGNGYPFLLTKCYNNNVWTGAYGPINPINDEVYKFMENFFTEIHNLFPDQYIHIGGDEVSFECWKSNPEIQKWMKEKNYTDYALLEQYYEVKLLDILKKIGSEYIIWQEVFDNGITLKPDTVVDVWTGVWQDELAKVTAKGFRAILSNPWYLNYISYGSDWTKYYQVEPLAWNGTEQQKSLFSGGEACMWGEYVDSTNLVPRLWPRVAAVAERLWSPASVNNVQEATIRLEDFRCRLLRRRIDAEPQNGPGYCDQEYYYNYIPPWVQ